MQRRITSLFAMLLAASVAVGCGSQSATPQTQEVGTIDAAAVPPPPVNQNVGLPDTVISNFTAQTCVGCHGQAVEPFPVCNDATQRCPQIANRHHRILPQRPDLTCTTCHGQGGPGGFTVLVDCMVCHGRPGPSGQAVSPHHSTDTALVGHCADCHGAVVQNYDDPNLYIPPGTGSDITPTAARCRNCHQAGTENGVQILPAIGTHHGTGLAFDIQGPTCTWCHTDNAGSTNIKICERCHSPLSLHSVEGPGPAGEPGYGHIGAITDCTGCHAIPQATPGTMTTSAIGVPDLPPGPTAPSIKRVEFQQTPRVGIDTIIRITGEQLVNVDKGVTFASIVVISRSDAVGNIDMSSVRVLQSAELTETTVYALLPGDLAAGTWDLRVVKEPLKPQQSLSNKYTVGVDPTVAITSAQAAGNVVTVTGAGFGPTPFETSAPVGVSVNGQLCALEKAANWTDAKVVVNCPTAASGATVQLVGVHNLGAPVSATLP